MARRGKKTGCGGLLLVLAALVAFPLSRCNSAPAPPATTASQGTATQRAPSGSATGMARASSPSLQTLQTLSVKGRAPLTGYDRGRFGAAWEDVNANGCDTRNDILRRDLTRTEVVDCVVMSGLLIDPYSGARVEFLRGPVTSLDVQIDHVVALANAWQTGAATWSSAKREAFANDRRNLLAVRGDLNAQKSDGDAATWLPPRKAFRCEYVGRQVEVKATYGLWVTPAEKAAIQRVLQAC